MPPRYRSSAKPKPAVKAVKRASRTIQTATAIAATASSGGSTRQIKQAARTPTASIKAAAQRAEKQQARQVKQAQRKVRRIIRNQPKVAERKIERRVSRKTPERVDIQIGGKRAEPKTRRTTVVSRQTAKQVLAPKEARRPVVRELAKEITRHPTPPKRVEIVRRGRGVQSVTTPREKAPKERTGISRLRQRRVKTQLRRAAKKASPGLAKELNRGFQPGETISPKKTALVAEAHGLPGITYAKAIAPGESGHQPGVRNPDDNTPSLFQITPSVQSEATQAKFDKIAAKPPGGYANPIAAAKQAAFLARGSSDAGVSNYVAFNPSAPQGHLPGGPKAARKKLYGKPKPVPQKLKQKAKRVLGKEETRKTIKKAKSPTNPAPKKKPGVLAGSRSIVKELAGKDVFKAEGRGDKEPGHSVGGMHDPNVKDAYAADLPVSEATVDRIAKKLGLNPKEVNYGDHVPTVYHKGYEIEFLPYTHGSGPHIHIGAKWVGENAPPGTVFGGASIGGAPVGTVPASSSRPVSAVAPRAKARKKRKARKMEGRERSKFIRALIAGGATAPASRGYERTTSSLESYISELDVDLA
jgi:hypothetical protein